MLLFQVQIDHMARALARTFRSPVVETIQGLPQHQQVFSCPCNKFFVVCFWSILFSLWPSFLSASFLSSTLRVWTVGLVESLCPWLQFCMSHFKLICQSAASIWIISCDTYLWFEIMYYRWCCVQLYVFFAVLRRMQPLARSSSLPSHMFLCMLDFHHVTVDYMLPAKSKCLIIFANALCNVFGSSGQQGIFRFVQINHNAFTGSHWVFSYLWCASWSGAPSKVC